MEGNLLFSQAVNCGTIAAIWLLCRVKPHFFPALPETGKYGDMLYYQIHGSDGNVYRKGESLF